MNFLDHSRPLLFNLQPVRWKDEEKLLKDMAIFFKAKKRFHQKKYILALRVLGANFLYYKSISSALFVRLGLSKTFYNIDSRYNPFGIKGDIMIGLLSFLSSKKYISIIKGFYFENNSKLTRVDLTSSGWLLLGEDQQSLSFIKEVEDVRLKDCAKNLVGYMDSYRTKKMRNQLLRYNKLLAASNISFKDKIMPQQRIYRIFNNSSFKQGGRFYGGEFQLMPKKDRKSLRINNQKVSEFDYHCLHLSILYHNKKIIFEGDAYSLSGYNSRFRPLVKKAIYIILNSASFGVARKAVQYEINKGNYPKCEARDLIHKICLKHKPIIEDFFNPKIGLDLQYKEALIAEAIIDKFLKIKTPSLVLPIHDSFICPAYLDKFLTSAMNSAYKKISKGFEIRIDKKY